MKSSGASGLPGWSWRESILLLTLTSGILSERLVAGMRHTAHLPTHCHHHPASFFSSVGCAGWFLPLPACLPACLWLVYIYAFSHTLFSQSHSLPSFPGPVCVVGAFCSLAETLHLPHHHLHACLPVLLCCSPCTHTVTCQWNMPGPAVLLVYPCACSTCSSHPSLCMLGPVLVPPPHHHTPPACRLVVSPLLSLFPTCLSYLPPQSWDCTLHLL